MPITGPFPESGVRIDLERPVGTTSPFAYRGRAITPTAAFDMTAVVTEEGRVTIGLPAEAPADLGERVRLLVRAVWKHAKAESAPPPRRIVRWRSDR